MQNKYSIIQISFTRNLFLNIFSLFRNKINIPVRLEFFYTSSTKKIIRFHGTSFPNTIEIIKKKKINKNYFRDQSKILQQFHSILYFFSPLSST